MITARYALNGAGCQNAAVAFDGNVGGTTSTTLTEEYDGTSWSSAAAMIDALRERGGAGTLDSAFAAGGESPVVACTEEFSRPYIPPFTTTIGAWTAKTSIITARASGGSGGTTSAGWIAGGNVAPSSTALSCTEEYDGSSWSSGGNLITARERPGGGGTQNAGLAFGGSPSAVEEYDGSTWASGGSLITGRNAVQIGCTGTQNAGLAFGGTPAVTCTEEYDGTSWSAGGALITARYFIAGAGTQGAGLAMTGYDGSDALTVTEEYNGTSWSSVMAALTATSVGMGMGTQGSALIAGGDDGTNAFANVYEWTDPTVICTGTYKCYLPGGTCAFFNRNTCVRCLTATCTQI